MAATAGARACSGRLNRQLNSLLHALGSARPDPVSGPLLEDECRKLLSSVNALTTLEGSAHDLGALRRTLESIPERIDAGVVSDMLYIWRLVASHRLLSACLLLGRLAGLPLDSRLRLACYAFQRLTTHGTAAFESAVRVGPALAQPGAGTHPPSLLLLSQMELLGHILSEMSKEAVTQLEPAALVLWLRSCTGLVRALPRHAPLLKAVIGCLASNTCNLCCVWLCAPFSSAIAADTDLPAALVSLLEPYVVGAAAVLRLPEERRPASCGWYQAACGAGALTSPPLLPALRSRLASAPARLHPHLVAATQLLEQVPADPAALQIHPEVHLMLLRGLVAYVGVVAEQARGASAIMQQPVAQQRQLVQQLLPCLASLPSLLRSVAGPQVPYTQLDGVVAVSQSFSLLIDLLLGLSASITDSWSEATGGGEPAAADAGQYAAAWCTSAAAALAAVPPLVQVERELRRRDAVQWKQGQVAALLVYLLNLQQGAAAVSLCAVYPSGMLASPGALQPAVFQLHMAGCRLVAWCCAGDRVGGEMPLAAHGLQQQLRALATAVAVVVLLRDAELDAAAAVSSVPAPPRMGLFEAALLAHWSAVRALQPIILGEPALLVSQTTSLAVCISRGPKWLALDPELTRLFDRCLDSTGEDDRVYAFRNLLIKAIHGPPLTVHLLLSGRLEGMLGEALRLSNAGTVHSDAVWNLLWLADDTVPALLHAAQAVLGTVGPAGGPADVEALAALQAAHDRLTCAPLLEDDISEEQAAAQLQQHVLPPARELAAALQAWWQRPEQQQQSQLEAAQAAARRSCAYLRCANLGGQGGPAAGEGAGSMRCSACRAVWYCGTACSHADWREGGHRRVCKALGAARAAEKERRRQEAAKEAAARGAGEES